MGDDRLDYFYLSSTGVAAVVSMTEVASFEALLVSLGVVVVEVVVTGADFSATIDAVTSLSYTMLAAGTATI